MLEVSLRITGGSSDLPTTRAPRPDRDKEDDEVKTIASKKLAVRVGTGVAALGATTALIAGVAFGAFSNHHEGSSRPAVQQSTHDNLLTAMHGEAYANAKYLAYSEVAGDPALSSLFARTARMEVDQHFAEEADLAGLVGTDKQNLEDSINGETYETTTMYPFFASQAQAAGDNAAAARFTELAADEAQHRDNFRAALASLSGSGAVPSAPVAEAVDVVTGGTGSSRQTLANLGTAMHGESYAYAKYMLYADHARSSGHPQIAALFEGTAGVELTQHFREEANLAGLAGSNTRNLNDAIAGESYETTTMYPSFSNQARAVGDTAAAARFAEIGRDEARHLDGYRAALADLGS